MWRSLNIYKDIKNVQLIVYNLITLSNNKVMKRKKKKNEDELEFLKQTLIKRHDPEK